MISSLAMAGTERNIVSVAPHIRAQGVSLCLVSMNTRRDSPLTAEFEKSGIERFDLQARRMTDPSAWMRFARMLRGRQIDIIHAQDQDTIIYAALAHRLLKIPTVMTRHVLFEPADTVKEKVRARLALMAARLGYDRIIAVSEAVRQDFSELASIPVTKIETIYNGLEIDRFVIPSPKVDLRARFGWDPDAPTVIMVAALRRGKGHEVLFEAIPQIQAEIPGVKIKLVGGGEIADQIRAQAAPYGDVIEFLGQRTDVPELLAASDVLTLPSWAEALPTVLLEAGAASLPCVATDVGGAREIVLDGGTGYIVPPGDADALAARLIDVLRDREAARAMGERARRRIVSTFSLERQAERIVDLYERVGSGSA
jgi:glycosyltransferase involved in cell wall biosynthesis